MLNNIKILIRDFSYQFILTILAKLTGLLIIPFFAINLGSRTFGEIELLFIIANILAIFINAELFQLLSPTFF